MMKKTLLFALGLALLAGLAFAIWQLTANDSGVAEEPAGLTPVAETSSANLPKLIIGDVAAPITIVEYGDFQCPICKRFFEQTEPALIRDYIDTGKARIEFRVETHIGPESVAAGEAAYCAAEQGKFRPYHDELYGHQGDVDFTTANLKGFAGEIGLDQTSFDSCLDTHRYQQAVADSNAEAQTRISGTPTFFIGETKISGAQPIGVFRAVLDNQ